MKEIIKIVSVLVLIVAFSSCSQYETEGFDAVESTLKKSTDVPTEILEEDKYRPEPSLRDGEEEDVDTITDDDDDNDDDEGPSKVDK